MSRRPRIHAAPSLAPSRTAIVVATLVALLALAALGAVRAQAVVGGTPTTQRSWPFLVAVLDSRIADPLEAQFCAGTLVAPTYVLTAAHCVEGQRRFVPARTLDVAVNAANLARVPARNRVQVAAVIPYPERRPRGAVDRGHDLALLRLNRAIPRASARLASDPAAKLRRARGRIAGWGATDDLGELPSNRLRAGRVHITSPKVCDDFGAPWGTICATMPDSSEPSACSGDSGGPLVRASGRRMEVVGVVSIGPDYCGRGVTTAFTEVATYRPWIENVIDGGSPRATLASLASATQGAPVAAARG